MELTTLAAVATDCAAAGSGTRWGLTLVLATVVVVGGVAIVVLALGSMVRVGAILAIPVVIAALLAVQLHTRSSPADCTPAIPPLPVVGVEPAPLVSAPPGPTTTSTLAPSPAADRRVPAGATPDAPGPRTVNAGSATPPQAGGDATGGPAGGSVSGAVDGPADLPGVPAPVAVASVEPAGDAVVVTLATPSGAVTSLEYLAWADGGAPAPVWRPVSDVNGTAVVLAGDSAGQAWQAGTTYWVQVRAVHPSGPGRPTAPSAVVLPVAPDPAGADPGGPVSAPG